MNSIEEEVRAFERDVEAAVAARARCVAAFRQVDDPDLAYLMAERLHRLGPSIIPVLLELIADQQSSRDVRYLAAWVAVALGDRGASVDVLCREVDADGPWSVPAANALARAGVTQAAPAVVRALERVSERASARASERASAQAGATDVTAILNLLDAAKALDAALPPDLQARLRGSLPPWAAEKAFG